MTTEPIGRRDFLARLLAFAAALAAPEAWSADSGPSNFKAVYLDKRELKCACVGGVLVTLKIAVP